MADYTAEPGMRVECIEGGSPWLGPEGDENPGPAIGDICVIVDVDIRFFIFDDGDYMAAQYLTLRGYGDDDTYLADCFRPVEGGTMEVLRKAARVKPKKLVDA